MHNNTLKSNENHKRYLECVWGSRTPECGINEYQLKARRQTRNGVSYNSRDLARYPLVKYHKCVLSSKRKSSCYRPEMADSIIREFEGWCKEQPAIIWDFPGGGYLAYLRHHGFPSPLLDWTKSPYIAAYFAMVNAPQKEVKKVSVFAYLESPTGGKTVEPTGPVIQFSWGGECSNSQGALITRRIYC